MTEYRPVEIFPEVLSDWPTVNFAVTDDVLELGIFLGERPEALRGVYKLIKLKQKNYEYQSFLGLSILFERSEDGQILYTFKEKEVVWEEEEFLLFIGVIDAVFGEIYPIGTVVELDLELLDASLQTMLGEAPGALVMLTGRRLPLAKDFEAYEIDYFGRVWPFGEVANIPPVFVSNMLIKNVIHMGLENEWEDQMKEALRGSQLELHQLSTTFMTQSDQVAYLTYLTTPSLRKEELK